MHEHPERKRPSIYPAPTRGLLADDLLRRARPSTILSRSHRSPTEYDQLKRRLIIVNGILAVLLFLVAIPRFVAMQPPPKGYVDQTVLDKPHLTVSFDRNARKVTRNGRQFLEGKDLSYQKGLYVEVQSASLQMRHDCESNISEGGTTEVIGREQIAGETHAVCYASSVNSYQANFTVKGQWYYIAVIPVERAAAVDVTTVEHIVRSVLLVE